MVPRVRAVSNRSGAYRIDRVEGSQATGAEWRFANRSICQPFCQPSHVSHTGRGTRLAEIRWTGPVDPDSILGQTLADQMRAEPSIQGLPSPFRDAVIREAIVAMHEP